MRLLFLVLLIFSGLNANFLVDVERCTEIKKDELRLKCYDEVVEDMKLSSSFEKKAKRLVQECKNCHGKNWSMSTDGERIVKYMSEDEILKSLLAYKSKDIESLVMNFQMDKYSKKEIEEIARFIAHEIMMLKSKED